MEKKVAVILGIFKKENEDMLIVAADSLKRQTYRDFQIYLYDNTLNPTTPNRLKEKHPDIIVFKNSENLGFAGGNNQGFREAIEKGYKYVALLNDDTEVNEDWLKSLVEKAESDSKIGAVTSKLLFFEPFIRLELATSTFNPKDLEISHDPRDLGVQVYEKSSFTNSNYVKRFFREGFYGAEYINGERYSWMDKSGSIDFPIGKDLLKNDYELNLKLGSPSEINDQKLILKIGDFKKEIELGNGTSEYKIKVPLEVIKKNSFRLIQNTGTLLSSNLDGQDRGSGEIDNGQYEKFDIVDLICGGASLIKTEVLRKAGLFDKWFITYYEDADLSMRIRKAGYKIMYEPKALVNHYHSSSSGEYSPWFLYSVWKNKPIFVIKNFGWSKVLWIYGSLFKQQLWWMRQAFRQRFKDSITNDQLKIHTRSMFKALFYTPIAILKRYRILKDR